ncbi:MAG: RNB domain-containing ribonuclease, partial [Eggerthellaceae bacterium]|nr:RNB domain-containing ribonuclease [Eggerthellaceae bacterium]
LEDADSRFAQSVSSSCASLLHASNEPASQAFRNAVQTDAPPSPSAPSYAGTGLADPAGVPGACGRAAWRIGVHIADVSHYVPWSSAVDVDARKRATSVYLVDRVVPMLPEKLSNEVCSLVPGKPRRVFTVDIVLDECMNVLSVDTHLGVIESKARLSYDQAQCYIDARRRRQTWQDAAAAADAQPMPQGAVVLAEGVSVQLFDALGVLDAFACARLRRRTRAGGIDFETTEAKVQLDAEGHPVDVHVRTRTAATSCIEEAMICANECVAKRLCDTHTPGIFRVHDAPTSESLASLVPILQEFGYDSHIDLAAFMAGEPSALQSVLDRAHGRPEAGLISALLLRAQQRAVYKSECQGHFGLALESYCHFTSPIRRYPDLVVHRMLRTLARGKTESYSHEVSSLPWLAEHSSKMERIADTASRESQELKLVEYMERFVGQEFEGIVSGVATYGLFVQLDNTAEGLVPVRSMGGEYFSFDPAAQRLTGQDSGRTFRLGQRISIRVAPIPAHARKLEFRLA